MTGDRSLLEEVVARISAGEEVDWEQISARARSEEEKRILDNLRIASEVYRSHRAVEADDADGKTRLTRGGMSWGPLELIEKIGKGGFSEIYRAKDTELNRDVALKFLKPDPGAFRENSSSLQDEGRMLASIKHPNVLTVYGAGIHDGRPGLWMEIVRGSTLEDLIRRDGPFGAREAILLGLDVCRALAAVHAAGLIHKDIKAQNVMREEGGRIVLMDLGSARRFKGILAPPPEATSGTPLYMAPEALLENKETTSADIYSLGVLLYHLVSDSYPILGDSVEEIRRAHQERRVRRLRDIRPDLPESYVGVVEKCIALDPADRFSSAGEVEHALNAALGVRLSQEGRVQGSQSPGGPGSPNRGHRRWIILLVGLILSCILIPVVILGGRTGVFLSGSTRAEEGESYSIQASFHRKTPAGLEHLVPGSRVAPGDELLLELRMSRSLFVYVLNQDERGEGYVLFPMAMSALTNPIDSGIHRLPGRPNANELDAVARLYWQVTSAGGTERFLIVASPESVPEIEADLEGQSRSGETSPYARLSEASVIKLRGVGRAVIRHGELPVTSGASLFDRVKKLADAPETTRGVWVRQIDFDNPLPG